MKFQMNSQMLHLLVEIINKPAKNSLTSKIVFLNVTLVSGDQLLNQIMFQSCKFSVGKHFQTFFVFYCNWEIRF